MSTIETLYLWMAAACLLAFIAGFSSGVWATLHIIQRWRKQWQIDREQPAAAAKSEESFNIFGPMQPKLIVPSPDNSFERPA